MRKNILIIDDSALMRRVTSDIIESDENFRVADLATNGLEAYKFILDNSHKYDAVILDINMPRLNGIELLKRLEKDKINLKIIVSSTVAKEGADITIEALEHGAFDFITKPQTYNACKNSDFGDNLIAKLKAACGIAVDGKDEEIEVLVEAEKYFQKKRKASTVKAKGKKIVIIASSTGGPRALQEVVPYLPQNMDVPVVIVQHMPEGFTTSMAKRLAARCKMVVKEAEDGESLKNGVVYIAKGGFRTTLSESIPGNVCFNVNRGEDEILKPSADIFISSVVDTSYDEAVCVVLTGMGSDGTKGILKLKKKKNVYIISQDKETSVVYGMPRIIVETGLVNDVLPLKKIAEKIINNTGVR